MYKQVFLKEDETVHFFMLMLMQGQLLLFLSLCLPFLETSIDFYSDVSSPPTRDIFPGHGNDRKWEVDEDSRGS